MQRRNFIHRSLTGFPLLLSVPQLLMACATDQDDVIIPVTANSKTVLVIGAGISGLAAAKKLKNKGFNVTVLEAQEKVGGRTTTDRRLGIAFDAGASWIHGPKGNPITNLVAQAGANTYLTDDDSLAIYDTSGKSYSDSVLDDNYKQYTAALATVQNIGTISKSFQEVFNAKYPNKLNDRLWKFMLSAYLEFDTGSDISDLSSINFQDDEAFDGSDLIITDGYDKITDFLAKDLTIRLNTRVTNIDYSKTKAVVTAGGTTIEADYVLVTVPLGVLKKNVIGFSPALPAEKNRAIQSLKMSAVNKFLLIWDKPFWDINVQYVGFTPETKGKFNYFMNVKKFASANALMTFAFGNYGIQTEIMTDSQVITEIMTHLKAIYGNNTPSPTSMLRTKWSTNINAYGSYSFATNGTTSADFDVLAQAINNKLFFGGEHTSHDYRGTVHGAYLSGIREADKIIQL